ncbi:flagellar hook assembly protein FlgD [Brucella intermedia]|uniref:flagellar hook assembly protein FlgD n=1 Tax=Brucella TaxID=234 RepID=UPI0009463C49
MITTSPLALAPNGPAAADPSRPAGPAASAANRASVDYNAFLKLLVTQMQNQDPTQPMDPTQYVSQLATFSNVEQAVQMNSKLDALIANTSVTQAAGWVGRTVSNTDGSVKGVVKSVTIQSNGMLAELDNGKKILIGQGIKIS